MTCTNMRSEVHVFHGSAEGQWFDPWSDEFKDWKCDTCKLL